MASTTPVGVYSVKVPPGDIIVPAVPDAAVSFRLTMAAIDPSEEPSTQDLEDQTRRATLKLIRVPDFSDEDDDDDYDDDLDDDDEEEDSDIEEANGGPSNGKKSMNAKKQLLLEALAADDDDDEDMVDGEDDEENEEDEAEAKAAIEKIIKSAKGKGKAKAEDDDDEDDEDLDDEDISSEEAIGIDETVICTLNPNSLVQQPLDIVISEGEQVFFKVSGNYTVHLIGNYLLPVDEALESRREALEDEYDMSPDEDELEDELDGLDALVDGSDDELDDISDPRITEVDADEDIPKLIKNKKDKTAKGKNKRPADSDEEDNDVALDDLVAKSMKKESTEAVKPEATPATASNGDAPVKLTKAEKRKLKKLKKNDGEAGEAPSATEAVKRESQTNGSAEKKVQFAKNLEQGPSATSSSTVKSESSNGTASKDPKPAVAAASKVRDVQGIKVDDRKLGTGPAAKKGSRLEMRYIGKLANGKQFDANKSGKPFSFKLGAGEVIKGWDIGLEGMQSGGERRIIVPAGLAYGKKPLPDIPANSALTFDVKCLAVK